MSYLTLVTLFVNIMCFTIIFLAAVDDKKEPNRNVVAYAKIFCMVMVVFNVVILTRLVLNV